MPGFHGQCLPVPPPLPDKIEGESKEERHLLTQSVLQGMAGVGEDAKDVSHSEQNAEQEHAFIKPGGHTASQAGHKGWGRHGRFSAGGCCIQEKDFLYCRIPSLLLAPNLGVCT